MTLTMDDLKGMSLNELRETTLDLQDEVTHLKQELEDCKDEYSKMQIQHSEDHHEVARLRQALKQLQAVWQADTLRNAPQREVE